MVYALPILSRTCKCPCGGKFTPPASRPGQEYIRGHKPKTMRPTTPAQKQANEVRNESAERRLNYKLALRIAERDVAQLAEKIDALHDEIETHRKAIEALQITKDVAVEKHGTAIILVDALTVSIGAAQEGATQ